jgi:alpha-glucoside transport system substrate-binding protein
MKKTRWVSLFVALLLVLAACGGDGDADTTVAGGSGDQPYAGEVVNIFGAFVDADAAAFDATVAEFEAETGIDVVYEGSGDFETQVGIRIEGGNAPDIAMFPQPGLWAKFISDMVEFGSLGVDLDQMADDLSTYLVELPGQVAAAGGSDREGVFGGWFRVNTKSWLWIPVPEFADAGYEAPETWDDLLALTEQIKADGNTPWCVGIESSGATGWVFTDWMEDMILRSGGPEAYDQWVFHEIPFNDPQIIKAANQLGEIMFPDGNVLGGNDGILATPFGDQNLPMFEDPPACYLAKQAGFITGFFPGQETGDDFSDDVFGPNAPQQETAAIPFPRIDNDSEVLMGAGDLFGVFSDSGAVAETVKFLLTPDAGAGFAKLQAGYLSPNSRFDTANYLDPFQKQQGEFLAAALAANSFRFDASDLMPASVGAGTFWTGMVDWILNGGTNTDEVFQSIEDSWPSS